MGMEGTLKDALAKVYRIVKRIRFDGAYHRRDIGFRVLDKQKKESHV